MNNIHPNGGPQKPPENSVKLFNLGMTAATGIVSLQALADTAATAGLPMIQIALLGVTVILACVSSEGEATTRTKSTRNADSDLHSELTALRIREYRLKYELERNNRRTRRSKKRI